MEPIAVIGIGCRFPGGVKDSTSFWDLLQNGKDAITEVPAARWDKEKLYTSDPKIPGKMNTRWGGFLNRVDKFDASFFQISPREATYMDPQQRTVLEVAWEALENAAIEPTQLADSPTGVFVGVDSADYHRLVYQDPTSLNAHSATGTSFPLVANRLSYFLNLHGPSIVVPSACSSSLVAVHLACQSLQRFESQLCLVGGVNLMLAPESTIVFSQAGMMATDGRCKTFDASADGYVRGEGCAIVVLKRLNDAVRDKDNIQAVIKGSAVNQDGLSNGITAPNGLSQQAVIRQALENASVQPAQISYLETHGTGTSLGDPIEVKALKTVLMQDREPDRPCWIGSVKTNIGHLEAAAGIAGLIKVVLSLQHREIPPHLHLKQLNPYIKIEDTTIQIPTKLQKWLTAKEPRIAGVSSFSFGGTNAHVIVEEAPLSVIGDEETERSQHILTLSAKCEKALQELVQRYEEFFGNNSTDASIADICFTANTGRSHFNHRLAIVAESREKLRQQLKAFKTGEDISSIVRGQVTSKKRQKIAFLFTGQGSQYINMGRELYETQPTFRKTLEECDRILSLYLDKPLLNILYPESDETPIDETAYTQPALFAIEYALFQLWQSWGIEPDIVMGHSVGEYVAATVAGVFSLEDGLKLIAHRGRLMQQLPSNGSMVAVMASEEKVNRAIAPYTDEVVLAAINGPLSTVISGTSEAVAKVKDSLEAEGIKTKQLQVSHAFHSPLMKPMLADFETVADGITYDRPTIPIVSNVTGIKADESIATASYWVNHVRQPVRFAQSMKTLHQQGYQVYLEIGAKPILLGMGKQCLPKDEGVWLPSLYPPQEDWQQMLYSLGQLYVRGVKVDWLGCDRDYDRSKVVLPTYPWQRKRYWIETDNNLTHKKQSPDAVPTSSKLSPQVEYQKNQPNSGVDLELLRQLEVSAGDRQRLLIAYLRDRVTDVMRLDLSEPLDPHTSLNELGLDSLMGIELKNQIESQLGVSLPTTMLLLGPSIVEMAGKLAQMLTKKSDSLDASELAIDSIKEFTNNWIVYRQPKPNARLRLFCFHYLGGAASVFREWSDALPSDIEVCPVQLPGREARLKEPSFTEFAPLVKTLGQVIEPYLDKPFAFYGHSLGTLLSFELVRLLRQQYGLSPMHLFVGGLHAPHSCASKLNTKSSSSEKMLNYLLHISEIPQSIIDNPSLLEELMPIFKADTQLLQNYIYSQEKALDCPISAFGGTDDPVVSPDELAQWHQHTNSIFKLQILPGKHMFLKNSRQLLLEAISQELMAYLGN